MGEAVRMRSAFGLIDQSEFDDQACPINFLEFGLHGHAYSGLHLTARDLHRVGSVPRGDT
jgi:hypothetical protein